MITALLCRLVPESSHGALVGNTPVSNGSYDPVHQGLSSFVWSQILYICLKEHSAFHSHSTQSEGPCPTDSAVTLGDAHFFLIVNL